MRMGIDALHEGYRSGALTPPVVVAHCLARIEADAGYNAWIQTAEEAFLRPILDRLANESPDTLPLYGVPFAIKDNFDLVGMPTTAACPALAYAPDSDATVVARLVAAGAIPLGKTNLDQLATGLVGTRSPYGEVGNAFDSAMISGGSSSGSAVALARGHVSFALGTDTAGSGRVPAAFNNLVGVKPSRGRWSCHGLVPACRTLDCPSLFTLHVSDAVRIGEVVEGPDPRDPYSRTLPVAAGHCQAPRIGVIPAAQGVFEDEAHAQAYASACTAARALGWQLEEIDFGVLQEAAALLYEGPWVSERYIVAEPLLEAQPDALLPVTREIISAGETPTATDLFRAQYRLAALKAQQAAQWRSLDAVLLPTTPGIFSRAQLAQEPIRHNSTLGTYTNFMNLLDLCAIALPNGFLPSGLPTGITLCAEAGQDAFLLRLAQRWVPQRVETVGAMGEPVSASVRDDVRGHILVAVCGAHLDGMPLNHQLTDRGGFLHWRGHTAPCYRFYALAGGPPLRPALVRSDRGGAPIEVEVWAIPAAEFGSFVAGIPAPLGIGKLELDDGRWVSGFIAEPCACDGAEEITALGGWRAFIARQQP